MRGTTKVPSRRPHPVDEVLPAGRLAVYGFQHVGVLNSFPYTCFGGDRVADGEEGEDSVRDQSAAGLTRLTETDREEFATLAAAYRERFGSPLIVCVRDASTRERVLREGWQRLENGSAQEHAAALIEIAKVAGHRFADLVADANPIASARARAFGSGER